MDDRFSGAAQEMERIDNMDIFSLFTLCGGLAFFLYGMTTMSKSLEKMAGGKLERMLKRMTSNPFKRKREARQRAEKRC